MKENKIKRITMTVIGVLCIGIGGGMFRYAGFGADPFTTMNLGLSSFLNISYGNWQLILNLMLFIPVLFWGRYTIGLGTVANMVFLGYISDAVLFLITNLLGETPVFLHYIIMSLAIVLASFGVACYIVPNLGVAPYDALQLIAEKSSNGKISYRIARIVCDASCIIIGIIAALLAGDNLLELVGIGTICNVVLMGPIIQFFKDKLTSKEPQAALAGE